MTDPIQRQLELPASSAEVWRAVTDPARLVAWLADEVELELRPGGEARFWLGEELRSGWVEEVAAPEADSSGRPGAGRLTFWWGRDGEPASRVELVLTPISNRATRLQVTESRPLEALDLFGVPLPSQRGVGRGPALVAA